MNRRISLLWAGLPVLVATMQVTAHDPSEHMAGGEAPDCAAMHQPGAPNMNMNDPVAQAMMKKCKNALRSDDQTLVASHETIKSDEAGSDEGKHGHDKGHE